LVVTSAASSPRSAGATALGAVVLGWQTRLLTLGGYSTDE
jgi:hypothetical protein